MVALNAIRFLSYASEALAEVPTIDPHQQFSSGEIARF
jgi:hypothetical protein